MVDKLVSSGILQHLAQAAKDAGLNLPAIAKTVEELGADYVNKRLEQWLAK